MHMRRKKNRDARLERVNGFLVKRNEDGEVLLDESFPQTGDLYLEIGCGKGAFASAMAARVLPDNVRYLAVELNTDAMLMAMEKCASMQCVNLRFLNINAEKLTEALPPKSVSRLFLNFSDPWPRNRDRGRRLTSDRFLPLYRQLLKPGADIRFKTDNRNLFDFSLQCFRENGFLLEDVTYDLHASPLNEGNIVTEYEQKWSDAGYPIHYVRAVSSEAQ